MRITGGKYKSRKIIVSSSFKSRPTTDFAKQGLFNILANHYDFNEVVFLDLFTGTGSIGLEMASRGCTNAELVDSDKNLIRHLKAMFGEFGEHGFRPVHADVFDFIRICRKQYDIVFADPPYNLKKLDQLPDMVMNSNILYPEGLFILEHPAGYDFTGHPDYSDTRKYGDVHFTFFRKIHKA